MAEYEAIELKKSAEVNEAMELRHILDDEIKMVIHHAESSGEKLYQPESNKFLAKLKIGEATFYAEYSVADGNTYTVHTAYAHKTKVEE